MRTRLFLLFAVCLLLCAMSIPAQSQSPDPQPGMGGMSGMCPMMGAMQGGGPGGQNMLPMLIQELGITDAQLRQMQPIFFDFAKKQIQIKSQVDIANLDLLQLLMQDKVDMGKVNQQIDKIGDYNAETMKAGVQAYLSARDVLTPAQRQKLQSLMLRLPLMMGPGGQQPMGPGMMPPPGGPAPMGPPPPANPSAGG